MTLSHTLSRRGALALGLAASTALVPLQAVANDNVILRLNFTPWAMHAQYFAALEQGFYAEEGLNVEIRPAAAGQQNEALIATGREHFGVSNADSFIKARSAGLPVVAVMADQPDTPFSIITLEENPIHGPEDMAGMKLSWFPSNVPGLVEPVFRAGGLTGSDIEFVTVSRGSEQQLLVAGAVDAIFGFFYGQALTLNHMGHPTRVFPVRDYGVEFQGNIIYTSDALVENDPELVERFLRATLRGLIWTKDNMDQAMDYIIAASPDRDHGLEVEKLEMIYEFYNTEDYADFFGQMHEWKWQTSIDTLAETGDLERIPEPSELFTNRFLENIPEAAEFGQMIRDAAS